MPELTELEWHRGLREVLLALLDLIERKWFPGELRTAEIRKQWKQAKRAGELPG